MSVTGVGVTTSSVDSPASSVSFPPFPAVVPASFGAGLAASDSVTFCSGASVAPGCSSLFSGVVGASVFGSANSADSVPVSPGVTSESPSVLPEAPFATDSVDSADAAEVSVATGASSSGFGAGVPDCSVVSSLEGVAPVDGLFVVSALPSSPSDTASSTFGASTFPSVPFATSFGAESSELDVGVRG
ncbi:Uncharacterised protein [Streptococcus pneumoniae]|nr:Uncharacterised protein [Streptococcus pneumoniae]